MEKPVTHLNEQLELGISPTQSERMEIITESQEDITLSSASPLLRGRSATISWQRPKSSVNEWRPPTDIVDEISQSALHNDVENIRRILDGMDQHRKAWLLNNCAINHKPILSWAASVGNVEVVQLLVENGVNPILQGRLSGKSSRDRADSESEVEIVHGTALHDAVRCGQLEVVRLLLSNCVPVQEPAEKMQTPGGTPRPVHFLVNIKDSNELTPLLALTDASTLTNDQFTVLIEILCEYGSDPNAKNPKDGRSLLYQAVQFHAIPACRALLKAGADVNDVDDQGETPLHVAAQLAFFNLIKLILDTSTEKLNAQDKGGKTALHYAAEKGCQESIKLLLERGADLSIFDDWNTTPLEVIFSNVPRPNYFFYEILNSKIMPNTYGINDRRFQLMIDFRILSPNNCQQMSVVVAIMKSLRNPDRNRMLTHPLIDIYLRAKWIRLRVFFLGLWLLHLLFVSSLSGHVICTISDIDHVVWSRRVLLISASLLLIHKSGEIYLAPRYFIREFETWLTLTCIVMSMIIGITGEVRLHTLTPAPTSSQGAPLPAEHEEEWTRHVAACAILLAWLQLILLLGRFPTFGVFALMFFTIAKNILKVFVVFYCLVIGFAISFYVQNHSMMTEGVFSSIIRTTVMMLGEYQFSQFFPNSNTPPDAQRDFPRWQQKQENLGVTTQLIFLLFLFLGSIVLVNLMIGLAVSDIQGLREQGLLRHMMKQAEFLLQIEIILARFRLLQARKSVPLNVTISPNCGRKSARRELRRQRLSVPSHVMEKLIKIAFRNQEDRTSDKRRTDGYNECINCDVDFKTFE